MEFPHMNDTQFPHINTVDVYKYQNNFDYARWKGKVSIKLVNVLWNSDYRDVVSFEDGNARDEWFDNQEGLIKTLESGFNITPDNYVKIPVPYNDAYRFNYLVVDMPMQTSVDNPIDFELENTRVSRWYYFIENMSQTAPSTTELQLVLDVWTTFSHTVEIPYLMLNRGHAPMFKTSVDTYLANPIANCEYLLADDYNYGNESVIASTDYKPIGNGDKYILFCAPYDSSDFSKFGGVAYSGNATLPSYYNEDIRWGYQLGVSDYEWKYGHVDYTNSDIPVSNQIQDGILDGCKCYAIAGSEAQSFFNDCANYCMNFIHGIKAIFMLDESLFTKGIGFSFRNKTIYPVIKKNNVENVSFSKEDFGYDSKYREITKLYTFPYASLEVTDDNGNSFEAKIENCGAMQLHTEVSLLYPYLNYNVFMSGINGNGSETYTWKTVDGTSLTKDMWISDFSKFMMNWNIPTYSIFSNSENEFAANNAADMRIRRDNAIKNYKNATRFANTKKENIEDTQNTNVTNVAASGDTNVTNVAASMTAMVSNVGTDNAVALIHTGNNNDNIDYVNTQNKAKMIYEMGRDQAIQAVSMDATASNMTIGAVTNAASMVAGGAVLGGGIPGAVAGAVAGVGSSVANAVVAGNNISVASTASRVMDEKTRYSADNDGYMDKVNANVIATNLANTNTSTQGASEKAARNQTMNNANAVRTKDTNNANATRTRNTEVNNATWERDANIEAAKANLVQDELNAYASYANNLLRKPYEQGVYSGDMYADAYQRRGIRLNIRTQTKAAIAQTGDAFLRFGYALHRVWDMKDGFHYGKHFTYWRADDIWINEGSGIAGKAVETIGDILMNGVTVWRNPDEIGKVPIYDNI